MKKIIFILISVILLIACKDKKKTESEPTPVVNQINVKINGSAFSCSSCGNTYSSGNMRGVNFAEGSTNRFIFSITGFLAPGTYSLVPFGNPSFSYEKDGKYYRGRGTLNLKSTDTSANGNIKKFIGSFNCITDTSNGVFYNFSEGVLNVNFN